MFILVVTFQKYPQDSFSPALSLAQFRCSKVNIVSQYQEKRPLFFFFFFFFGWGGVGVRVLCFIEGEILSSAVETTNLSTGDLPST